MIDSFRGDYNFLSDFYPAETWYRGIKYASSEHAYMSAKSDDNRWKMFCADSSNRASLVKAKSYELGGLLREDWVHVKYMVMFECLQSKFSQEPLRQQLIDTKGEYLKEGNDWGDAYWGVDVVHGGENNLGKVLMSLRESFRTFKYVEVKEIAEEFADARVGGYRGTFKNWEEVLRVNK